jgi:hypothetical protein
VAPTASRLLGDMNPTRTVNPLHSLAEALSLFESIRTLDEAGNRMVRAGVRNNLITFPSEVPVFKKTTRPDLQAKFAVLYFIRGWSTTQIGLRYGLGRQRVAQIITRWRVRAVRQGYIQLINEHTLVPCGFLEQLREEREDDMPRIPSSRNATMLRGSRELGGFLRRVDGYRGRSASSENTAGASWAGMPAAIAALVAARED